MGLFDGLGTWLAMHTDRRLDDVFQRSHVRIQIELLEDHADMPTLFCDGALAKPLQVTIAHGVADLLVAHHDIAAINRLEVVDTTQESGFPRAGWAENHDHLAGLHIEIDALEHLIAAKALVNIACPHKGTNLAGIACIIHDGFSCSRGMLPPAASPALARRPNQRRRGALDDICSPRA